MLRIISQEGQQIYLKKNDPYLLSADTDSDGNEVIAIVGKDTDCTFLWNCNITDDAFSFNNKEEKFWMFRLRTMLVSHSVDLSKDIMEIRGHWKTVLI